MNTKHNAAAITTIWVNRYIFQNVREYLPIVEYAIDISMNIFLNYLL